MRQRTSHPGTKRFPGFSEHPNPARGQVFLKKQGLMRYKVNGSTKMADMSLVRAHGVS